MKKTLLVTLSMILIMTSLVACGKDTNNEDPTSNTTTNNPTSTTPVTEITEDVDEDATYCPEGSDFVYSDKTMTEIVGLTDQCTSSLVLIFPREVTKISNVAVSANSEITTVIFLNDDVVLENVNFAGSNITTVQNLPTSMTTIPANMFYGCTELNTLGDTLGVITIPEHITNIESDAFGGCARITSVDASHITTISDKAFEGCKKLKNFTFSEDLVSIGNLSFYMCGFETIDFPSTLESIGENAFTLNLDLTTVNIPESTVIHATAFDKCEKLTTEINFASSETDTAVNEDNINETTENNENVESESVAQ